MATRMNLDPNPTYDRRIKPNIARAALQSQMEQLRSAAEGINGPNTFNLETAAYGYIKSHEKVVFPSGMKQMIDGATKHYATNPLPPDDDGPVGFTLTDMLTITYWNKRALENAGVPEDVAFFVAFYRARLTYLGYMHVEKADRAVAIDEVEWRDDATDFRAVLHAANPEFATDFDAAETEIEELEIYLHYTEAEPTHFTNFIYNVLTTSWLDMVQHIVLCAQQYAAMTYLVFRQFGHHYTSDYDAKYNIMWKATTLEKPAYQPSNEMIHRVAVHSFGLKTLHTKFYQNLRAAKLAETLVDRSDVAPAGMAIITTCNAAIQAMRSLTLWNDFYAAYRVQIDALNEQAKSVKGDNAEAAIRFHKNARLFGAVREVSDNTHAEALASYAKGFITSLGPRSDLSKQKTLDKKANQNPINVELMSSLIQSMAEKIIEAGDLSSIIPKVPIRAPTQARITEVREEGAAGD